MSRAFSIGKDKRPEMVVNAMSKLVPGPGAYG
jgi:hypothetical protein